MEGKALVKAIERMCVESEMDKSEFYEKFGITAVNMSQWRTGMFKPSQRKLEKARKAAEELGFKDIWEAAWKESGQIERETRLERTEGEEIEKTIEIIQDNLCRLKQLVKEVY